MQPLIEKQVGREHSQHDRKSSPAPAPCFGTVRQPYFRIPCSGRGPRLRLDEGMSPLLIGIGTAATLGLAAGAFAYASRWPASQIFGRTLIAPARPGELALTFDDGPNPAWTPRLLDILERHNVRATFFLVGSYAATEGALVRRIAEGGHLIGNHSWSHPN